MMVPPVPMCAELMVSVCLSTVIMRLPFFASVTTSWASWRATYYLSITVLVVIDNKIIMAKLPFMTTN